MPSKSKQNDDEFREEGNQKLQAVVLADAVFGAKVTARGDYQSFGLKPWSSDASTSSQILCRLNNVPLVDYVLDFLASNGVEQVILVMGACNAGNESPLEEYLLGSRGKNKHTRHSKLELLFLKDTSLTNAGDALRELYKRNWIRASKQAKPFFLVSGDVVADLDLREALERHGERSRHDSAAVMTVVLKPVGPSGTHGGSASDVRRPSIVPRASDLVVGLVPALAKTFATVDSQGGTAQNSGVDEEDGNSSSQSPSSAGDYRIMYYDNGSSETVGTTVPCSLLTQCQSRQGGGFSLRHDLMDTGISICSPDVLGRLEDNFDYLDLAHDFVTNSVAEEEDGLQTRIFAHVLEPSLSRNYAARVVDFQTYHAISKDLLQRWAYPTVLDQMTLVGSEEGVTESNRRYKLCKVADYHYKAAGGSNRTSSGSNNWLSPRRYGTRPKPLQSLETTDASDPADGASSKNHYNYYQYKESLHPAKVGRTSVVHGPGMMGSHVVVGEDCLLKHCVVGDSVLIGDGAELVDCHVLEGAVIEKGAKLRACVIAKGGIIREGAILETGCFVGEGCVIGSGVRLPAFSRVTLAKDDDDDDWGDDYDGYSDSSSDSEEGDRPEADSGDTEQDIVGLDGKGRLWKPTLDSDDYSIDSDNLCLQVNRNNDPLAVLMQLQSIGGDPTSYYRQRERRLRNLEAEEFENDDDFSDFEEDEDDDVKLAFNELTGGTVVFGDEDDDGFENLNYVGGAAVASSDEPAIGRQKGVDVVKEMTEICMEFDDECHPIENLSIELNSFKFSQNATYSDCASACLLALMRKMKVSPAMSDGRLVSSLKAKLETFWTGMLQKLCRGIEEEIAVVKALEHAATVDQQPQAQQASSDPYATDVLQITTEIAQKLRSGMAFRFVLQTLHDQEVLSEDAILAWANERRSDGEDNENDPKQMLFRMESVQAFLEWLEEEDSSDDDDSDSDSDEDDSE